MRNQSCISKICWGIALVCFFLSFFTQSFASKKRIADMTVNYEEHPMSVERPPVFGWKMLAETQYGAAQQYYRIVVAESQEQLLRGDYCYDSGKKRDATSLCRPYEGKTLQPSMRYFWKVFVWDEKERMTESAVSWFETSLMDSGWSGAKWIGSQEEVLSKYTANLVMEYDVQVPQGSNSSTFLFGAMDKDNYWAVQYRIEPIKSMVESGKINRPELVFYHLVDGRKQIDTILDLSEVIPSEFIHNQHHIRLSNRPEEYNHYELMVKVDSINVTIKNGKNSPLILKDGHWAGMSRLLQVGYEQPVSDCSYWGNLVIKDYEHGTVLYADSLMRLSDGSGHVYCFHPKGHISAPMLRKEFEVKGKLKKATAYFTSRGIYELYVNGKPACEDFFNPGWTDYQHRFMYNIIDVTFSIREGKNVMGAVLGEGWWKGVRFSNQKWSRIYGANLSLMGKLLLEYEDGSKETIITDTTWLCSTDGPIMTNGLYEGEEYDARREMPGWNTHSFDASRWMSCRVLDAPPSSVIISPYVGQPVRCDSLCTARSVSQPLPHTYIYDMGQNMVGVPRIRLKGKEGLVVTLRYGEMKYPEIIPVEPIAPYTIEEYEAKKGQLYTENYRTAMSTDRYILRGDEEGEIFEPHFTCHGFRYLEITGLKEPLPLEQVQVLVLNSLQGENRCHYETSNPLINKLFNNIQWGERGNFVTIPTDCPQRDERAGWSGDAQIFCRTATYNRNVNPFFHRWMYSVRDDQKQDGGYPDVIPTMSVFGSNFGWAEVGIILPWQLYQQYGDKTILEENYEAMKKYISYIEKRAKDYILPYGGYGDWVAVIGTQSDLTNTCYAAWDVQIMAGIADILGKTQDKAYFEELFQHFKSAFNRRYVRSDGCIMAPAGSPVSVSQYGAPSKEKFEVATPLQTQTAYIIPLHMKLIEDSVAPKAAAHLAELVKDNGYKLNTGFIGTPYINMVLSEYGYDEIAYRLIEQQEYPSWLYPVLQGATTMWERWNSYTIRNGFGPVSMNSFNHYAYGAVQDWLIAYSAGIQRDEHQPGYKHILLQPRVGGSLSFVKGSFQSEYGLISSSWQRKEYSEGFVYKAIIPANTTATLTLPVSSSRIDVEKGKKGIISCQKHDDYVVYELMSGSYQFNINNH